MEKRTKIAASLGFALPLLCCTGVFITYFVGNDGQKKAAAADVAKMRAHDFPTEIADLRRTSIPEDQNAAPLYQAWIAKVEKDPKLRQAVQLYGRGITTTATPDARAKYLEAEKRVLPLIPELAAITTRPKCDFHRDYSLGYRLLLPEYTHMRDISRVLTRAARARSEAGDWKSALKLIQQSLVVADHAAQEPLLIGLLVSVATESISSQEFSRIIYRHHRDRQFLAEARRVLSNYPPYPDIRTMMGIEFITAHQTLLQVKDLRELSAMGDSQSAPGNQLSMMGYGVMKDTVIARVTRTYAEVEPKLSKNPRDWDSSTQALVDMTEKLERQTDPVSKLSSILFPTYSGFRGAIQALEARRRMLKAGLDTYALPTMRGVTLPIDPFANRPVCKVVEGDRMVIYCIGVNGRDEQGHRDGDRDDVRLVFGPSSWNETNRE